MNDPVPPASSRVVAVHVGTIRPLVATPDTNSAFVKERRIGAVRVSREGLEGDEHAFMEFHGGPDRAVLACGAANYERWREEGVALSPGSLGENLVVEGFDEHTVSIGDRFRVGTALLEVTMPRTPCENITHATNVPNLFERVRDTGRTGWLLRVLEAGDVRAGDVCERVARPFPAWTVARAEGVMTRVRAGDASAVDDARALAMVEPLAARWREKLLERATKIARGGASLPEHVQRNREAWDAYAPSYVAAGEESWAEDAPCWGIWRVPEAEVGMFPEQLAGLRAIELGCGTGYVSAWMKRRGASVIGIDNSPKQLETARRLQREHGLLFPVLLGNAEEVPFPDASFDFVISEYGASIWADPHRWVPEAARLLRPGGELRFIVNGTLAMLTLPERESEGPAGTSLRRPYFGMHRFEWADERTVEFHLGYGDWIRLLRANGFEVLDLVELRPAEGATTRYTYVTLEWARQWPSEQAWKARKRG